MELFCCSKGLAGGPYLRYLVRDQFIHLFVMYPKLTFAISFMTLRSVISVCSIRMLVSSNVFVQ